MSKLTIFNAYNSAKKELKNAGIDAYAFEARQIIRHITGYDNAKIMASYNEQLTPLQTTMYNDLMRRRVGRYPLQYLLGTWSFYGLDFYVGEGVLVPRADTETLVDYALDFLKEKDMPDVLDLCSGSGCIAVAIAKNKECNMDAVEKYETAFKYMQKNIEKNDARVNAINDDIYAFVPTKKYDLIVSNPPYISAAEMEIIDTETSFEPDTALYGGEDGLAFYRFISESYKQYIKSGGTLAFEVGYSQGEAVKDILKRAGYKNIGTKKDIDGNQRVIFGTVN